MPGPTTRAGRCATEREPDCPEGTGTYTTYNQVPMRSVAASPRADALELKAKLFRGLAEPSRLKLLEILRRGERSVGELVAESGLSQANVSAHLSCLRDCGLVASRSESRFVFYRIAGRDVPRLLDDGDETLGALAERIAACVNYRR